MLRSHLLQVLFADGSVSFSPASGPAWVPEEEEGNVPEESEKEGESAALNAAM